MTTSRVARLVGKSPHAGLTPDVLQRAREGDRAAQERVLKESSDLVRGMLYRMVGDRSDFEDLQQTVFVRLLKGLKQYREESAFSTWVGSICVNVVRDHFRRNRVRAAAIAESAASPEEASASDATSVERQVESRKALVRCRHVLDKMSTEQRVAFVLRVMGYSVVEIAELMNAAKTTTRMRLYWARKTFARMMGPHGPEVVRVPSPAGEASP